MRGEPLKKKETPRKNHLKPRWNRFTKKMKDVDGHPNAEAFYPNRESHKH